MYTDLKKKSFNSVLIDISHPAKVHLFKNLYNELTKKGYHIFFTTRNQKSIIELLEIYNFKYVVIGKKNDSIFMKFFNQLNYIIKLKRIISNQGVKIAIGSITLSLLHILYKGFHLVMLDDDDDDIQPFISYLAHPFCDTLLSPSPLKGHRNKGNTIFYLGYHELAYLYPTRFKPDKKILSQAGLTNKEKYFVLRFNSFKAHHDIGAQGLALENKRKLIITLKSYGKIFITSERELEPEFEAYRIKIDPHKIHSFLYYATMFIGDSQTMTSEAAILGVPAFKCNSFAGKLTVPNEIENKYGLCYSFQPHEFDKMLSKIKELLINKNLKQEWAVKRQRLLNDKIDVTAFLVWFIENYPNSTTGFISNPEIQYQFK
ncbi:MAG: DUF354 domain-containing protein [Ignavibacteriales bacterium]|nr:MAG: DUF354 domain-containing protein [Ignavibacteriales bacterium]